MCSGFSVRERGLVRVLLLIMIVLFSSVQCLYSRQAFRKGVESNSDVFLVAVACDCVEGKGVGLCGVGDKGRWEGGKRGGMGGGGSSENWRLQFGVLRVFMESNRPPSLAEGP